MLPAETRLERACSHPGVVALAFLILTLGLTWPLAFRFTTAVPAGAGDLWQNVWNFWWWKTCLAEGRNPNFTPYLFFPYGTSLVFHTHSPLNMLLGLPVAWLLGPGAAYNFCILLAIWLSAFGAWLLIKDLTGSTRGAFLAGFVFAFFPQHLEQTLEHLNLSTIQFLPLSLWAFLQLVRGGGWRFSVGLGLLFSANALADWHLGLKLLLLLVALGTLALFKPTRPRRELLRALCVAGAVALLLVGPAAVPLLGGMASGKRFQKAAVDKGIDAAFLLRPHFHHPLFGGLTREVYAEHRAYLSVGFTCYLGVVALALAALAVRRRAQDAALPGSVFLVSLVLSLGATPHWNGVLLEGVRLPFALIESVPLLGLMRVANRFLIPASLGLAALVALGFSALRVASDKRFALCLLLLALDYLWLPYPMRDDQVSPVYAWLAESGPHGAVLDLPFGEGSLAIANMRTQTVHGRPIAGGYASVRDTEAYAAMRREPALANLGGLRPPLASPVDRERLHVLGFGVAVLHKRNPAPPSADLFAERRALLEPELPAHKFKALRQALREACGNPIYEDEQVVAFDLGAR